MLEDGLSYPLKGEWLGRILIGGGLSFFSFLLLPILPVLGYTLRVIEKTVQGEAEPPEWEDWGDLTVDGLKVMIVGFIYSIVPIIVIMGLGSVIVGIGGAAGDSGGGIIAGFGLMMFLLFIPVMLIVYYILPAALGNMATEGSLGAAFDFGAIKPVVLSAEYFVAVLMPIVIMVLLNVVTFFLAITVIGYVFVPFLSFYGQVAIFRMFGTAFAETSGKGGRGGTVGTAPA